MAFHFWIPGHIRRILPGGWLGVDVFFVLSGYLITKLLLDEYSRTGAIRFRTFYDRRWRRLLPVFALVILTWWMVTPLLQSIGGAAARVGAADNSIGERWLEFRTYLSMSTNWFELARSTHVSASAAPMWSLAVEEQFYLIWPLAALALLRAGRHRAVFFAAAAGSALSATLALVPVLGLQRVYYGTDTRAQALLIGAALAAAGQLGWDPPAKLRAWTAGLGVAVLAAMSVFVTDANAFRDRGGQSLVAVASAAVIAEIVAAPRTRGAQLLSAGWLRYVGRRSYALYLWHVPLALIAEMDRGPVVFVALVLTSFGLAELSWRLVEVRFLRPSPDRPGQADQSVTATAWGSEQRVALADGG